MADPELRPRPLVDPRYLLVLAGEFTPVSDPRNSFRSLAELVIRTYENGKEFTRDKSFAQRSLIPEWAPNVKSRVMLRPGDKQDELIGISLAFNSHTPNTNLISFNLMEEDEGVAPELFIKHDGEDRGDRFSLDFDRDFDVAKSIVTKVASDLFWRAHYDNDAFIWSPICP